METLNMKSIMQNKNLIYEVYEKVKINAKHTKENKKLIGRKGTRIERKGTCHHKKPLTSSDSESSSDESIEKKDSSSSENITI